MFGITDARAGDGGRGEEIDIRGQTSEMPSTCEKRPPPPGRVHPRVKQPRLDERLMSRRADSSDGSPPSEISDNSTDRLCHLQSTIEENGYGDEEFIANGETSVGNGRLKRTDINANDQRNYNRSAFKLKELRIILQDVRHTGKLDRHKCSSKGLWEVEKILEKKEQQGRKPLYLIKWRDWAAEYNTWEPIENLVNCTDILESFEVERRALLENFKEKQNFYPDIRHVEEYITKIRYKYQSIDLQPVEEGNLYVEIADFLKQKHVRNSKLERSIKHKIIHRLFSTLRKEQLESLQEWQDEMNTIAKGKPVIKVENIVDLERAPEDFYYIDDYLPGHGVSIPDDPPIGCECESCETKAKCCFSQHEGGTRPYTSANRIRVPPGTPIYECNKRCACDINCPNRVVQRGSDMKVCIFRTANGRGWGIKTLRAIKKGTFVTEYVGEVITNEEAEKRGKEYDAAGRTYLFDLDYNETEGQCPYTVDAAMYGNVSHFINHSCDPNLAVYGIWINCLDPNLPKLALFAKRDIKQNEELTFDYMCQFSKKGDTTSEDNLTISSTNEKLEIKPESPDADSSNGKTLCKCGAASCRRYLF